MSTKLTLPKNSLARCILYNVQNCNSVSNARFQIFQKMYGTSNNKKFMRKIKGFDSSTILPCWESLKQKVLRTSYVNSMCYCGWLKYNGVLKLSWFDGDSVPLDFEDPFRRKRR
ncbi:unnamed protein product [Callosobruchus maculatus]|uniref:Uncharacterized protein n=1 Tax=Callosobruchus maculatus TaxID=64391 RepID=A0A653DH97_CALMS|nr:unnamed protein product [Callosobruchus maculatus]